MFIEKTNDFFGDETSVSGKGIIALFIKLFVFMFYKRYSFFNQIEGKKRFSSIEIEIIIFC